MKKEREEPKEIDEETLRLLNSMNNDPAPTASLNAKAGSSNRPSIRRKGMTLPQQRDYGPPKKKRNIQLPIAESKGITIKGNEKKIKKFAEGMGLRKIELNRETNSIQFELEEELYHAINMICSWKKIQPETYLSKLLAEYILIQKKVN